MTKKVFNLIIVDESGSMSCVERATVNGINETLQSIRKTESEHTDAESLVTLTTFSSAGIRTIYDATPASQALDIQPEQYCPNACTPLYDAIGRGILTLRPQVQKDDVVLITIITDGEENSSREFSYERIQKLIKEMKEQDWVFTFIGANIDVKATSQRLGIDLSMSFTQDDEGTQDMFDCVNMRRACMTEVCLSAPEGVSRRDLAKKLWEEDE